MSTQVYTSPTSGPITATPANDITVQNYIYFSTKQPTVTPSSLSILGASTQLDGYTLYSSGGTTTTTANAASFFTSTIVFSLNTPIYTDDESDVITFQVALGSQNTSTTFNVICTLTNLGQTISSPVYQLLPSTTNPTGIFEVNVNKWFTLRSPGSFYTFTMMGFAT